MHHTPMRFVRYPVSQARGGDGTRLEDSAMRSLVDSVSECQ